MAFDDPETGKRLLYWGSDSEPIRVRELAPDRTRLAPGSKPREILPAGTDAYERLVEGAWVVYRRGWYYLFYSGDRCCGSSPTYAAMVARSKAATGPFEKLAAARDELSSVILQLDERWDAPGHNSVITDEAGNDWMVYHAIDTRQRYLDTGNPEDQAVRRPMLIDRIEYRDGWPQVGSGRIRQGRCLRVP
jgi:arabinan endo-1,5-alpha-L-arabinosidase